MLSKTHFLFDFAPEAILLKPCDPLRQNQLDEISLSFSDFHADTKLPKQELLKSTEPVLLKWEKTSNKIHIFHGRLRCFLQNVTKICEKKYVLLNNMIFFF